MRIVAVGLMALVALGAGCDRSPEEAEDPSPVDEVETQADSGQFVRSEDWPDDPQRVVSMAPNVTEVLFEMGMGDRVVAVTRYCDWPEEVEQLPAIGGMLDPDYEAILGAEPDVVIGVVDGADHGIVEGLDQAGVAYGFVRMDDRESVRQGIGRLGRWLDREKRSQALVDRLDAELAAMSERVRTTTGVEPMTALMVFDRQPVVAAGPGSFADELMALAGFENVLDDRVGAYPVLDIEGVLAADPDVIIDATVGSSAAEAREYWERFETLDAIDEGRLVHIGDPVVTRPGVRLPEAVERLGEAAEGL